MVCTCISNFFNIKIKLSNWRSCCFMCIWIWIVPQSFRICLLSASHQPNACTVPLKYPRAESDQMKLWFRLELYQNQIQSTCRHTGVVGWSCSKNHISAHRLAPLDTVLSFTLTHEIMAPILLSLKPMRILTLKSIGAGSLGLSQHEPKTKICCWN